MDAVNLTPRENLDALQAQLASRRSTFHFAHAGIAMVWSLIIAGASAKLSWDTPNYWWAGLSVGLVALAGSIYSVVHYRRGMRDLKQELVRFETLKALRRELNVDNPAAFLPQ